VLTPVARSQILLFLYEAKRLISKGNCQLVPRKKNLDALSNLGWEVNFLFEHICSEITPEHYVDGPKTDYNFPGEDVWIFGTNIEENEYYIKLKIRRFKDDANDALFLCISFHPVEHPLKYPFRGGDCT